MIASVDAVEKSDLVGRAVRQAHAHNTCIKINRPIDVRREAKDVRESLDARVAGVASVWSIADAGQQGSWLDRRNRIRRCLRTAPNLGEKAVVIVKPDSIRGEAFRGIHLGNTAPAEAHLELGKILLETQK